MGPVVALQRPVELATVKATPALADFPLITRSRLSVTPVTPEHFQRVLEMSGTKLPAKPLKGR
jgi:predicted RNA-binding protein with PUA-like domain